IIPCYNYGRYLQQAVESIIEQTFRDFEIIIVNDGSNDSTRAVAENLIVRYPDHQIRLINQENSGQPAISRNRGITEARGEYILCLDADDMILPAMLEKCLKLFKQNKTIAIAYTDRQDFDGVDQVVLAGDYDFSRLKYANQISYCALFRREIWDEIGGYRTNIKGCEDWDFWVAAGARGFFGLRIPEPLFKYRRHETGIYQEVLKNFRQKHAQIVLNNPEVFESSQISLAKKILGRKSGEESKTEALVSVIVPTFNRPHMLKEALGSILSQTYRDFEIIVVNDGGTDVSELIQNFQDPRIKYFQQKRTTGPAAARNTGIKNAAGRYIALLDDDDIFYPEHLETAVEFLNDQYPVVYTDAVRASYAKRGDTYTLIRKSVPYSMEFDRNKLLIGNISPVNCFIFEKQLALKAGLFNESLNTLEDWDFWIKLSSLTQFKHIAQATVQVSWRKDGTTMTSSLGHEFKKNREKIYKKYQNEINQIPNIREISEEFNQIWANDWKELPQLTSIVILTFNQIDYTKKCIESVFKHTKEHFELIVVDNGSSDGTVEYLQSELRDRRPGIRIKILQNKNNLGFAAGNNQGMAKARGDYILLLNNDVVVTRGWLQRLLACAEQDSETGIVGPRTNYVAGPQRVTEFSYDLDSLRGLDQFAEEFANKNKGQNKDQWRIVGFCMLIKRKVIEKVGGLDTRYGLGNFEDDDFCIRAKLAGFKAQIAQDCFVHHFGGKTFSGAKIDYQESLNKNWEIFKKKWDIPAHTPSGPTYRVVLPKEGFNPNKHYCPLLAKNSSKEPENEKLPNFAKKNDFADNRFSDLGFNTQANPSYPKNTNQGGIDVE
ncbi:MAG: glycosyltransferase, partial [Desulfobacterales bacterium]|nr:glycosyltransferase [Desulfobacterales bacterium]